MRFVFPFVRALAARAFEPSTYAGLGVIALSFSHALGLDTPQGRYTVAVTALTGIIAIAKKEGQPFLNKLLAVLNKGTNEAADVAPALTVIRQVLATQKTAPPELIKALDEVIKGISDVQSIQKAVTADPSKTGAAKNPAA